MECAAILLVRGLKVCAGDDGMKYVLDTQSSGTIRKKLAAMESQTTQVVPAQ